MGSSGAGGGTALQGSQTGTAAARPAANTVAAGYLYYATDTNTLSESNGSAWTTVVAGGGGSSSNSWNTIYVAPTGALAETWSRATAQSVTTFSPTSGFLYLCAIPLLSGTVVSNISLTSVGTAFTTPSHYWFGLYDNNRNQLAVTADQTTTAWGANTVKTLAIATVASGAATSFTTTYSGLHYIGFMAAFASGGSLQANALNALNGLAPIMCGSSDSGQTTPPAFPHQATAISSSGLAFFYSYVS